jgi:hypothetical protein
VACNIGSQKICVHLNLDASNAKAAVYEFNELSAVEEEFMGFVDFKNFKEIGLDESNISINTTSRFVYLTRSRDIEKEKDEAFFKVWINLLLVDPYSPTP